MTLFAWLGESARAEDPGKQIEARIAAVVARELADMQASTTADLVRGAVARPLVVASTFVLEHGDGRGMVVVLGLAPGEPGNLPVPTGMEYLRFLVRVEDGGVKIVSRPRRDDLVIATKSVLADEGRAMTAAAQAFTAAKVPLPAGYSAWRDAVRSVTYDARLPREQFVGDPSWSILCEPWDEAHGGWNMVLLSGGLGVEMVNGRRP